MDSQTQNYLQYYTAQSGGSLSVFEGHRGIGQNGRGLGDILRGVWRTVFPILARGATTFLGETLKAKTDGGMDWGAAAKSALTPAAQQVLSGTSSALDAAQKGRGRKRRRRQGLRRRTRKRTKTSSPQLGQVGTGHRRRRKRRHPHAPKRKRSSYKKGRSRGKKLNFLNF